MANFRINNSGVSSPPFGSPGGTILSDAMKKTDNIKSEVKIGTWNVNSMLELGKAHNIVQEMKRLDIKILGISESRWKESGSRVVQDTTIYYSGSSESSNLHGVAIAIDKSLKNTVKHFLPVSPRVLVLQLNACKRNLNLIQVYAPTADKEEEELENFYKDIDTAMRVTKGADVTIVLGDLNAKVGEGPSNECVGRFGLGERNDRGDRLLQFCQEKQMVITNTLFKLPRRRLYTWKSPKDTPDNIVRNQIDYILIKMRYKNAVKSAKTYPGADIGTDHTLLVARIHIRLKKLTQPKSHKEIDVKQLRDVSVLAKVYDDINQKLAPLEITDSLIEPERVWQNIKSAVMEPSRRHLERKKNNKGKDWMTESILRLMEERRKVKNISKIEYRQLQNTIRYECRKAKERWLETKCQEMEELQRQNDSHNLHKKIKELVGGKKQTTHYLVDENGKIVVETKEQIEMWERYIERLFDDERERDDDMTTATGPEILIDEVEYAIRNIKEGKAVGPDELPGDILKLIKKEHLGKITHLFNLVYQTGDIPADWLKSTFITLPKKPNAKKCEDHRTISLMSHTLKTFLKVIHKRIVNKLEENISDTQFGFRNGLGTREALFAYNVIIQRCLDVNQTVYVCFLDYNKAFDKVRHGLLISILKDENIDSRDIQIIKNLYFNQKAEIRVQSITSKDLAIKRGVRQGCVLSPLLFNVYSERIMTKALEEERGGININGRPVNNIRYADDTVLLAETMEDLQRMLNNVIQASEESGLTLNTKKTKYMIVAKTATPPEDLYAGREKLEKVDAYNYLGSRVTCTADYLTEIKIRIEKARAAFLKMRTVLTARDLSINLRTRLLKCYVFPVLLYGVEAWTLNKECERKLQAFEMWSYRRILRIPWTDRVTNIEVLNRMGKEVEVLYDIKRRKLSYLGHVMRGPKYEILHLIIQGKIVGKRSVGRRRISWLRNLREWFNCSSCDLFRAAANKVRLAMMMANLRDGDGT
uniref:Craniofacial development protein 2 n=2 Tax=Cacopsylla melanoneura TaxID=428564 RepID=A0A8D8SJ40_9HEMI